MKPPPKTAGWLMQDSDQAAGRLREIADVIHKALRDPEFIRLANEPDTDKSSRMEGEDMPESAHMRCVAEEATNAVLNRIKIRSIKVLISRLFRSCRSR
jgi:hypothetical protein